jgi:adenylate cyclase
MTQNSFVRWAEAETEFAVGLKLDPNNADTWAMLSELMVLSGRPADALGSVAWRDQQFAGDS